MQSERVLDGPTRVEMLLDVNGRYALVSRFGEAGEEQERTLNIVDWKNHKACALPAETTRFETPLWGPKNERNRSPLFWLPVIVRDEEGVEQLRFSDEHCTLQDSHGKFSGSVVRPVLVEDGRELLTFGDGEGNLSLADPWLDQTTRLASKVRAAANVLQISDDPQALWLLEDGKLTQRRLDGTLQLSLGKHGVTEFSQTIHSGLRVAYIDGGDLYEAIGPQFEPVLITNEACRPQYRSGFLDLFQPCAEQQLVRILLFNGKLQEFDPGVFQSSDNTGFTIEYARNADGKLQLYVEPPGRSRVEVEPPLRDPPLVIDSSHLAGLMEVKDQCTDATSSSFAVWNADDADEPMQELFDHVNEVVPFVDIRTSSFLWLMHHNVIEEREAGPDDDAGTCADGVTPAPVRTVSKRLSMFSERTLSLRTIAADVPQKNSGVSGAVRGYSIELLPGFPEPLLLYVTNARPLEREPKAFRGELRARLLSGELGATIHDDVTSYVVVTTPLPGVLYGVEEGPQPGLWFAAL